MAVREDVKVCCSGVENALDECCVVHQKLIRATTASKKKRYNHKLEQKFQDLEKLKTQLERFKNLEHEDKRYIKKSLKKIKEHKKTLKVVQAEDNKVNSNPCKGDLQMKLREDYKKLSENHEKLKNVLKTKEEKVEELDHEITQLKQRNEHQEEKEGEEQQEDYRELSENHEKLKNVLKTKDEEVEHLKHEITELKRRNERQQGEEEEEEEEREEQQLTSDSKEIIQKRPQKRPRRDDSEDYPNDIPFSKRLKMDCDTSAEWGCKYLKYYDIIQKQDS